MDSKTPPPDDFEALLRLLELKRHERPPPGFFNDFSDRVMARIAQQEAEMRAGSWWARLVNYLRFGGLLSPANAVTACGLVFVGASLYMVLSDPGAGNPTGAVAVQRPALPAKPAGWSPATLASPSAPVVTPQARFAPYTELQLAPVPVEVETNDIPADLFTLPSMRALRGVQVDAPRSPLVPR